MNINMKVIDHKDQRYETVGDWQFNEDPDSLNVLVSTLQGVISTPEDHIKHEKMNFLIQFHELIEAILCYHNNIHETEVDEFDMQHPELTEPGEDPRAPYHKEHMIADVFERMMAIHLGVNWVEYGKRVGELMYQSKIDKFADRLKEKVHDIFKDKKDTQ